MRRLALALLHEPVLDRHGNSVASAITNLDLHDIARSCCCYGLERYFVAHPVAAQRELVHRVVDHWLKGAGGLRIPDRILPMSLLHVVNDLDQAIEEFGGGESMELWTTSAHGDSLAVEHAAARHALEDSGPPVMLVFGTGWGLAPAIHQRASRRLSPIRSRQPNAFNHLSVRAAVAILLDRLLGERLGESSSGGQGG